MPTLLGLAGLSTQIPPSVQGRNYAPILESHASTTADKPASALYLGNHARGVYTGKHTFVVREKNGRFDTAFAYDNEQDPNQMHRISPGEMDGATLASLKTELYSLLRQTNDKWYREGICRTFLAPAANASELVQYAIRQIEEILPTTTYKNAVLNFCDRFC